MIRFALLAAVAVALVAPAGAPSAPAPIRLVATVGPTERTITVTRNGRKVTTLRPGKYRITVRDRSRFHNFVLTGPGVGSRTRTTLAFVGTTTWNVTFRRGGYRYVCTPHALHMNGSFRVR